MGSLGFFERSERGGRGGRRISVPELGLGGLSLKGESERKRASEEEEDWGFFFFSLPFEREGVIYKLNSLAF